MVAFGEACGARSDCFDDAGTFVAACDRQDPGLLVSGREVVVRVAQAAGHHLDADLTGPGVVDLQLDDLVLTWRLPKNPSPRQHGRISHNRG